MDEDSEYNERMAGLRLKPTKLKGPPGAVLYDPEWIFQILENYNGLIVLENDQDDDARWFSLVGAGLPQDMLRVDFVFLARAFHTKYKDFAIHARGVKVDSASPEKGKGGWRLNYTDKDKSESYSVHVWFMEMFLLGSTAQLIAHYNPNINLEYSRLTRMGKGIRFEIVDHNPDDKKSSIRLIENDILLLDPASVLAAAERAKVGRPSDSGNFKKDDLPIALEDTLKAMKNNGDELSQAQLLYKLSSHPLNKKFQTGKTMSLAKARRNKKTVTRWLESAGLTWDDVVKMYDDLPSSRQ